MRKTPLKRAGKRTREWESIRRKLKVRFEKAGITECELKFNGCWIYNALGFAHLVSRNLLKGKELEVVVLACHPCHGILDFLFLKEQKESEFLKAIANRERQP